MIKFIGEKDGKRLYGFGLSRGNMEKLLEGKPILIDLDILAMRAPDVTGLAGAVLIFGGEDEQACTDQLKKAGLDLANVPVIPFNEEHSPPKPRTA